MGKIGILTFHRASNYGAVLQSYALQTELTILGADAEIIDYRCEEVENSHNPASIFHKNSVLHALKLLPNKFAKYRGFNGFRKRKLKMSRSFEKNDIEEANELYSTYIVGSDQVWSPLFSGNDDVYQLTFAKDCNRYSYACSFGFDIFPENLKNNYIVNLDLMKVVSVREASAKRMLQAEKMESRIDLDPTMLLPISEWDKFAKRPVAQKPYILVYTVQPPVNLLKYAKELSKKTACEIIYLNNEHNGNKDIKHVRYSTPEEFVGWFSEAEYVLTNSFHGTVFSILYSRKCKIELETRKKFNNRSRDLLSDLRLDICRFDEENKFVFNEAWDEPLAILEQKRECSIAYLKQIILDAEKKAEKR